MNGLIVSAKVTLSRWDLGTLYALRDSLSRYPATHPAAFSFVTLRGCVRLEQAPKRLVTRPMVML